jgi:2-oxoglutarate ferredoxin oxidoreductase subunit alpha
MLLTDGYIANGSEPWKVPNVDKIPPITPRHSKEGEDYVTFARDPDTLARKIAIPGTPGQEHRIGGLERDEKGNVSYDNDNHHRMSELRAQKVAGIEVPDVEILGHHQGSLLVIGWGGTYGAITSAVYELQKDGAAVSAIHLTHLNPLPKNLGKVLKGFNHILIPELNHGQLCQLIRSNFLVDAISYSKMQGRPFSVIELKTKIREIL